jgi:hypothetical protein
MDGPMIDDAPKAKAKRIGAEGKVKASHASRLRTF